MTHGGFFFFERAILNQDSDTFIMSYYVERAKKTQRAQRFFSN